MKDTGTRWSLPDFNAAVSWCRQRNHEGIRCILHLLGEYATGESEALEAAGAHVACVDGIAAAGIDASLSVKLTALGITFDRALCLESTRRIMEAGDDAAVAIEIDMEGRHLVGETLRLASMCTRSGFRTSVALQAYLDRTGGDLADALRQGCSVRIVKGAYAGDASDAGEIRERFRALVDFALAAGTPFSIGTHDPALLAWVREKAGSERGLVEFGFLKGLSDATKRDMAARGWRVAEYVPVGPGRTAYETRRERYLQELERIGNAPAP